MKNSKIDWCDDSWNPITGCKHGCEYCYARRMVHRFEGRDGETGEEHVLIEPVRAEEKGKIKPYPFGFDPTYHRYRVQRWRSQGERRNVFVCSMADLFGRWVPFAWQDEILRACLAAHGYNYLFLTKDPQNMANVIRRLYDDLVAQFSEHTGWENPAYRMMSAFWFGSTVTNPQTPFFESGVVHTFVSIEPILQPFGENSPIFYRTDWIIVGAESGTRKGKAVPEREWLEVIVKRSRETGVPLFMKSSLAEIWGEPLIQEFPEGLQNRKNTGDESERK